MATTFEAEYDVSGYRFRLRSTVAFLGEHVATYLEPFRARASRAPEATYCIEFDAAHLAAVTSRPAPYFVTVDGHEERSSTCVGHVIEHLLWTISRRAIEQVGDHIAIHAAAASIDGAGVVLPAPMAAGKTTLVAGLVHSGFSYLTDEMALIDPVGGWLVPFPRALWVDRRSVALIPGLAARVEDEYMAPDAQSVHIRPDDLRHGAIGERCRPAFVVVPSYEEGSPTTLEPLSRARALQQLVVHSPNIQKFGGRGLEVLTAAVAGAACYRLRVGDLASAVGAVRKVVDTGPGRPSSWSVVSGGPCPERRPHWDGPAADARPLRAAGVAGVEIDGETVLYDVSSGRVHLLNPVAGVLWANFDGHLTLGDLSVELAEATGQPAAEVRTAAIELAARLDAEGLLERAPRRAAG